MAHIRFRLTGTAPLLQHNERLANPLDPHAKEVAKVAKKRSKTEADYEMLAKLEFKGGLYYQDDIGPYAPGTWIEQTLVEAAKKEKLGTVFKAYIRCVEDQIPLAYPGPRTLEQLWNARHYDQRCVGVRASKTLRTRPCFRDWSLECTIIYDEVAIEREQVIRAMMRSGEGIGLGDYRPRFGRFTTEVIE
jgi:hypothetical protein